ncbi:MAG: hypothetical protein OXR66_06065 [Candidatus Woesearchaeota archaeon]|nr:hypothetical protein [Candidatus Woesearchaeota archaeon]
MNNTTKKQRMRGAIGSNTVIILVLAGVCTILLLLASKKIFSVLG